MQPIVIQMPESSPWAPLLPALIGVFGAILGVLVTSRATRSREREHRVWERRCDLQVAVMTQTRVVDKIIDSDDERTELTFEDPSKFAELQMFCSVSLTDAVRYYQLEYQEWGGPSDQEGANELKTLGIELRARATGDLGIRRVNPESAHHEIRTASRFRVTISRPARWLRRKMRPWRERREIARRLRQRN